MRKIAMMLAVLGAAWAYLWHRADDQPVQASAPVVLQAALALPASVYTPHTVATAAVKPEPGLAAIGQAFGKQSMIN